MIVVMYHYIRAPGRVRHTLAPAAFAAQLDAFEADGGIVDARAFVDDPDPRHPGTGRYLLSFDDGLREHREVADELSRRGHSACFFINRHAAEGGVVNPHRLHLLLAAVDAAALERELDSMLSPEMFDAPAQARFADGLYRNQADEGAETRLKRLFNYHLRYEFADALLAGLCLRHLGPDRALHEELYLADGDLEAIAQRHVVGNHGDRHRVLSRLDAAGQAAEIGTAHDWLSARLGHAPIAYCYAYGVPGSYDDTSLEILRDLSYRAGFVFGNRSADESASPLEIERVDCNRLPGSVA